MVPRKAGKRLKPSQPKFGVLSVGFFLHVCSQLSILFLQCLCGGCCNTLMLIFHRMVVALCQSSSPAQES